MDVLIVEDDAALREGMGELASELAQVRTVGSVVEALEELARKAFDLVISDLRMGADRSGGRKIIAAAREHLVPVVIVSALGRQELEHELRDMPPDDLLLKPFQLEDALGMMERFLARRQDVARYAALKAQTHEVTFIAERPGFEIATVQHGDDRFVRWFRVAPGTTIERTPKETELSVIVEGRVEVGGAPRIAGEALHAAGGIPTRLSSPEGALGVTVVFR